MIRKAVGGALVALTVAGGVVTAVASPASALVAPGDPSGDALGGGIDVVGTPFGHTANRVVIGITTANNIFSRPDDSVFFGFDLDGDRSDFEADITFDPSNPTGTFFECYDPNGEDDSVVTKVVSGTELHVDIAVSQLQSCGLTGQTFEWGVIIGSFDSDAIYEAAPNDFDIQFTEGYTINLGMTDPAARFVSGLYSDFLDRSADASGLNYWTEQTLLATPRVQVASSFARSDEWIGVTVDDMYETTLGRPADSSGRNFWINQIRNGRSVPSMGGFFYGSDEYFSRSGGNADSWVRALYADILERPADQSGVDYWVGRANAGMPRDQIALNFFQSVESRRKRVTRLYDLLLHRAPDAGGLDFWAGRILTDGDIALAAFLAGSDEYFNLQQP